MTADVTEDLDLVGLEVLRMRLKAIVEEMGIAMIRSAGSPVITEAGDFNTALFDAEGRILGFSDAVQLHIGSGSVSVQNLIATIDGEPLYPGDAFICNDPHTSGASHPPDVNVISPVFHDDELVGWAQSQAHLVDVGGMTAGGFAPDAYDCFSEAIRFPPGVKIYERGQPVESVRRTLLNNVRLPALLWNDVRSLVASNNTGIRRLTDTIAEIGLEDFRRFTRASFELAEKVVRDRVALIADGVYTADEWVEHNGHVGGLHRIHCAMTKAGDQLTFDFTGSSPQTDGYINNSLGSTIGMVASAVVPILAWDVPFNEGVMTACTVVAEPGSLVNPTPPAPCSNGHIITGLKVSRVVTKVLNDAFSVSESELVRARSQGVWADSWTGGISAGVKDDGEFFVLFNMDGGGIGSGAQSTGDGLDCAGAMTQLNNSLPDVEMNEMMYPLLYLWKRLSPSSAGHGAHRGGQGLDFAWTLHGAPAVTQTVFAPTTRVVPDGFGGGLPAGGSGQEVWRTTAVSALVGGTAPFSEEALAAERTELLDISAQNVPIGPDDVFHQWIAGGGGYGDPLLRRPEAVADDVAAGYVTAEAARAVYGVVVIHSVADPDATRQNRRRIRRDRLGHDPEIEVSADAVATDSAPRRGPSGWYCPASGASLGSGDDWTAHALTRTHPAFERLAELGVRSRAEDDAAAVWLDEFVSPACGTLLRTRIRVEPRT